ncbi:alpha/beta hydrolase [Cellulosimicrobium cellulans]|uniref:Esterase n=1 Tax=Cellulosimicrobium cellulans TaxID=1710 RepID=A0A4Y4DX66_CELCE|nr:alpha/beta hydrolase family protein [Cellulosimicrobium cellulans]GED09267.1 esterase [Cellulosimicrobium cellulans]
MALVRCSFYSDVLEVSTTMTVVLPQATTTQIGMAGSASARAEGAPVLYLLHGMSDDETIWTRRTSLERYVADRGLAVVMPRVERSFYADEAHGHRYWTFLSEELPSLVDQFFRVSSRREDSFVAGLSMGGYGAFRWALRHPERFAAAASLSGVLDLADESYRERRLPDIERVFGDREIAGSDDDLLALLRRAAAEGRTADLPDLFLACGTEDFLVDGNRAFERVAGESGVALRSEFSPGTHEWGFWDRTIQDVLDWLPLPGTPRN